jgi:hypothetical protein
MVLCDIAFRSGRMPFHPARRPTWVISMSFSESLDVLAPDPGLGAHELKDLDKLAADAAPLLQDVLDRHVPLQAVGVVTETRGVIQAIVKQVQEQAYIVVCSSYED